MCFKDSHTNSDVYGESVQRAACIKRDVVVAICIYSHFFSGDSVFLSLSRIQTHPHSHSWFHNSMSFGRKLISLCRTWTLAHTTHKQTFWAHILTLPTHTCTHQSSSKKHEKWTNINKSGETKLRSSDNYGINNGLNSNPPQKMLDGKK